MMNQYNQANALQYDEQRERSRARNDMARGDIYGAVTHRARYEHDHARRDKILEEQALSMGDYQRAGYLHREANSFENAARRDDFRSNKMECQLRQHRSNEVYAANRDRQHGNMRGYHLRLPPALVLGLSRHRPHGMCAQQLPPGAQATNVVYGIIAAVLWRDGCWPQNFARGATAAPCFLILFFCSRGPRPSEH